MSIKLDNFDYDLIEQYYLKNLLDNQFWLFGSHGNEELRPTSDNTENQVKTFLEKTVFGVKYLTNDISFMVPLRLWRSGTTYVQFDDTRIISDQPFFVVVEPEIESGSYHIFKCLSNNYSSPSIEKPEFNSSIQDGIYKLSDGYMWKYMSSTPFALFRKFSARGLVPVVRNKQVETVANEGIYNIKVENPNENSGYERIVGNVDEIEITNGITRIFLKNTFIPSQNIIPVFDVNNTYSNRAIYIQKSNTGAGIGAIELTIRNSGILGNRPFVTVGTPDTFNIELNDIIEILPKIEIVGNGSGASAIAIIKENRIADVQMLQFGDNYTSVTASVVDPVSFNPLNELRQDIRCIIRPIISPKQGHGSNIFKELRSKNIGLSKIITSTQGFTNVPSSGSYSKVGIVKQPVFDQTFNGNSFDNRMKINLAFIPGNLSVGDVVRQGVVSAIVHEINSDTNDIFVIEYDGPYTDTITSDIPLQYENVNFDINSIEYSPYAGKTGDLLTIVDATPIERDKDRSEQIRIILDF